MRSFKLLICSPNSMQWVQLFSINSVWQTSRQQIDFSSISYKQLEISLTQLKMLDNDERHEVSLITIWLGETCYGFCIHYDSEFWIDERNASSQCVQTPYVSRIKLGNIQSHWKFKFCRYTIVLLWTMNIHICSGTNVLYLIVTKESRTRHCKLITMKISSYPDEFMLIRSWIATYCWMSALFMWGGCMDGLPPHRMHLTSVYSEIKHSS